MTTDADRVDDWIRDELAIEWQRKESFETRALAIVAANVGLVTLFFAVADQIDFLDRLRKGWGHTLLLVAFGFVIASTVAALVCAFPGNYKTLKIAEMEGFVDDVFDSDVELVDVHEGFIRLGLAKVRAWKRANRRKAIGAYVAFVCIGVAAVALVGAMLVAQSEPPHLKKNSKGHSAPALTDPTPSVPPAPTSGTLAHTTSY